MENDTPRRMPNVPPFVKFVCANVPMVFDDSLSYYEALCALWKYVQGMTDVINNNATLEEEYIEKFDELKKFVDEYFDNLDVQEEINNKLDEMAEKGELAFLLNRVPISNPNFSILQRVSFDTTQTYEGYSHASMQGFCYANGNLIACFRNHNDADNLVRLVEINTTNGSIIRQEYLELNHANAISYSEKDDKLYVASCAKMVDGVYTNDNTIFTVDYDTFTILDTITVSNIPAGHRIRSVWYDNATDTLYGGDEQDMFIIDESTETITDTIELETTYIDTSALNQTLKKVGEYFIGVYVSFITYWDLKGRLVKIEQIDTVQNNEYIGELEDIAFDENGNLIIGSVNYDSPRLTYRNASFYITNNVYNKSNSVRIFGASTTSYSIYVDASSVASKEDGSEDYPFKSLQRAVNYVMRAKNNIEVVLKAGNYPYLYVHGIENLNLNIAGNATIDGLEILDSNVIIYRNSSQTLAINGVSVRNSTLRTDFDITFNAFNRDDVFGSDYNLYVYNSKAVITNGTFVGNDNHTLARVQKSSEVTFSGTSFADYAGYYAIEASSNSVVYTYDLTLDQVISSSEHNFRVADGSRFYTRNDLKNYNNWQIESQGMKYPSECEMTPEHTFFGKVCTVDYHFNYIQFRVKYAGANNDHKDVLVKIDDLNNYVIDTTSITSTGTTTGKLELQYNSTTYELTIYKSSSLWHAYGDGSDTFSTNESDSPTNTNKWCKIEKVTFLSL